MTDNQHILLYIQEKLEDLTKHEKRIAQYFIDNPEKIITLSAQELGRLTDTSASSVIRCTHKLDFKGFTDLKLAISRYLPQHESSIYQEITQDETVESISKKLIARATHTLAMTEDKISSKSVNKIVHEIYKAETIIVFGIGASSLVASDLCQKFTRIGKQIIQSQDTHFLATAISSHSEGCVLIGISNSGENAEILSLAKVAQKYKVKVIGLSQSENTSLGKEADYMLVHDASSEESLRLAATSSLISQLMTIDILFYSYLSKDYNKHVETMSKTRDAVELFLE
ncbi:MurR/RpiR family transcriptional regulator [Mammaliicoccus stepanovicii]|uniref:Putative RpiR family transcriptional regulator n=1 Tax=Mammaliicoccus stepanovicii TaxID=643214 RepID=A0A239YDG2_9STAP|nr:MurR/RpiR family transcriptional regulator [Mammaliicoccus stepanovicii]PNZ75823.1 MurR/RpiR family transcriptional regulator [Mammaliicoccus stepanovicii]GGI42697.1 RpiR family transcriptional regulator [Mammaliicoccus stepanovicii]SNV57035.1 putative RpiR family transcriptional regulator [Mammaliicoccus stepanovicii]